MGTRFTRVTVVGPDRQVDISLPADAPLATQMPAVLRLLSVPPSTAPVRWRLASPESGTVTPGRTLADAGILDGTTLYLTEAEAAPPPPFVDDVESEIARTVPESAPGWSGRSRQDGLARLWALVLLGVVGIGLTSPAPVSWWAPAGVLLVAIAGAAAPGPGARPGGGIGVIAGAAAMALVYGIASGRPGATGSAMDQIRESPAWVGLLPLLGLAAGCAAGVAAAVRRAPGLLAGAGAVAVVAGGALLADRLGMPAVRTAALVLLVGVALVGMAGRLALRGAGLVPLLDADEAGRPVLRRSVRDAVERGLTVADGLLWAAAILGSVAVWVLIQDRPGGASPAGPGWVAPALGLLGGSLFAVRSRMFSRARHVLPGLVVGVVAVVALAFAVPRWLPTPPQPPGVLTLGVLAVVLAVLAAASTGPLGRVAGARLSRLYDRLELLGTVALIPGVVLLFRVIPTVTRWWS